MPELIIIAAVFALVWLQAWLYGRFCFKNLDMKLSLSAQVATEGDRITIAEALENAKMLPLPWIDVKFQISGNLVFEGEHHTGADSSRSELFSIGPYKRITRTHRILCARRGYYNIKSMSVTGQDLLMSRKYIKQYSCGESLIVYPAAAHCDPFTPAYRRITGAVRALRFINPDPFEFRGIREYRPEDPLKNINHRATAKTGGLMVNVFEPTTAQHVTLWLNTEQYGAYSIPMVYERSISLVAALAEQLTGEGLTVELRTGAKNILAPGRLISVPGGAGREHLLRILEALALVDLTQPPEPIAELMRPERVADSVHILISACDDEDVENAAAELISSGQDVVWILPRYGETRMRVEENESRFYWAVI